MVLLIGSFFNILAGGRISGETKEINIDSRNISHYRGFPFPILSVPKQSNYFL
jgi:hypothetical protein